MSKLNQIQNALLGIDQATFQKLCDAYLYRTLDVKEISSLGSVAGESKTRTGQPDTLITLNNGKHVFMEVTTEKTKLLKKLSEDLDECFDEAKTGVPLTEVETIFLASNRKLTHTIKTKLIQKGQEHDCEVRFLDLDTLTFELYQKFQPLAKEFLGIELDTGQILSPDDFVEAYQKSKFATPLDNKFYFREQELEEILASLENCELVVLSGRAGVGKSRLALECAERFITSNPTFQPYVITNRGLDLYENLKAYFGNDGDYLIVVDDANRLSQLSHILYLLKSKSITQRIKIVLTVRDYAVNQLRNEIRKYSAAEIEIKKFSQEEIAKLLENEFEIRNQEYQHRIHKISDGNPRLAIMAAKVAAEANRLDSINDVSALYDIYFSSINEDLDLLDNQDLIQIAGIVSFFRTLDRAHSELFEAVAHSFGFTIEELWEGLERLHELEIVDMDYQVAKVSDQILGTYLFYKAFFKDEILDFSILLSDSFENFSRRLVDSLSPVLNTFNTSLIFQKLKPHVEKRWQEVRTEEVKALAFIKLFHHLKEIEFLIYLKRQIELTPLISVNEFDLNFTPEKYQPLKDRYLDALRLFQSENIGLVLDVIFEYLERNLQILPEVIHLLKEDFCFDYQSHYWNYLIQQTVIDKLIEKTNGESGDLYKRIFVTISPIYTQMIFRSNTSSGLTVTIHTFPLRPVDSMIEIRRKLWGKLIELYDDPRFRPDVLKIIQTYNKNWHKNYVVKEIVENDAELLLPFVKTLDPESYENCILANSFLDFLQNVEVGFNESLRAKFSNETYEISQVLFRDDRRALELSYDDYGSYKKEQLEKYFEQYQFEDYQNLLDLHCPAIQRHLEAERGYYQLHHPLINVLLTLAERDRELFVTVIKHLLDSGNELYLAGFHLVNKFIQIFGGPAEIHQIINSTSFKAKTNWLFSFYHSIPEQYIDESFLAELYELYRTANLNEIPPSFEALSRYASQDPDVFVNTIATVFERVKNEESKFSFQYVFDYGTVSERLGDVFKNNLPLLKDLYFHHQRNERYPDHKGKALEQIFELDGSFLFEYFEFLLTEKTSYDFLNDGSADFLFLWELENYDEVFISLFNFIYEKEATNQFFWRPSFIEITIRNLTDELKEKAVDLVKMLLRTNANDRDKASYIFQIVTNCFGDRRAEFVEIFLKENKNLEDFARLKFETNHVIMADMGSLVPAYEGKIEFYESLLPLFSSIDLLEHRLKVEETINSYRQRIEDVKKKEFIGDY